MKTILVISFTLLGSLITGLWKLGQWWWRRRQQQLLKADLHPFFTYGDIKKATQFYVPTHFQSNAPSEYELDFDHKVTARQRMLTFFLNQAFRPSNNDQRFYLILAGSGMGKTTFLINLYRQFLTYRRFGRTSYDIHLMPMAAQKLFEHIDKIPNPSNSILLLDGLDEDPEAVKDYKKRLNKVLDKVQEFRYVVFTCRTQFFPNESEVPHETSIMKFGTHQGYLSFAKMYLSPFDERDIHRYLRKKYGRFQTQKKSVARKIVAQSPNLMVRPMVLNYIDDLVESGTTFIYASNLYHTLIEKWIEREAQRVPEERRQKFREELFRFSKEVAINIFKNRQIRRGFSISHKEIVPFAQKHKIDLEEIEMQSRSLLNRDAMGQYKFAHKSILEYFLALHAVQEPAFSKQIDFKGMDLARQFFDEMCLLEISLPTFQALGEEGTGALLDGLERPINQFSPAEVKQLVHVRSAKLKTLDGLRPLNRLETLDVSCSSVKELPAIRTMSRLKVLQIADCPVSDLTPLEHLSLLEKLDASNSRISDVQALKNLRELKEVSFSNAPVSSLEGLFDLYELEKLFCDGTQIKDLSPIRRLRNLQELHVHHTPLSSLSQLRELTEMKVLHAGSTKIDNVSALRHLVHLRELYLASTQISSLKGLKDLRHLNILQLDYAPLRELAALTQFPVLNWLSIRHVQAPDLLSLAPMQQLNQLVLGKNQFPQADIDQLQSKLPNCQIRVE
ncbi:MAG: hypothetical protein AAF399_05650 [Bacteroidota bacterium]